MDRTHDAEISMIAGVINPIKTNDVWMCQIYYNRVRTVNGLQLLIQFEAVDTDTPLLRIERGKTSLGKTQPAL